MNKIANKANGHAVVNEAYRFIIKKKKGSRYLDATGSFDEKSFNVVGFKIRTVKCFDSPAVTLASTCASALPFMTTDRYHRAGKQSISVPCPSIVKKYNQYMGGVDLLDDFISYYRIRLKSKKYYHRLFFHFLDMTVVTGWLLYRWDCNSFQVPQSKKLDLLNFKGHIADSLRKAGKDVYPRKKEWPFVQTQTRAEAPQRRALPAQRPQDDVRGDKIDNWPEVSETRKRCQKVKCTGKSNIFCSNAIFTSALTKTITVLKITTCNEILFYKSKHFYC